MYRHQNRPGVRGASLLAPPVVGKSVFEEAGDYAKDKVLTPSFLLRLIPFMGWTSMIISVLPGWPVLQNAFEFGTHVAPGLAQGESFSDAFAADYGARLKIATSVMLGAALAAASTALGGLAAGATGGSGAVTTKLGLDELEKKGREVLGDKYDEVKNSVEARADRELTQGFNRLVGDATLKDALGKLKNDRGGNVTPEDLKTRGLDVASVAARMNVRQDIAALAINAALHQRVYGVNEDTFDPATGMSTLPEGEDRSSDKNSTWALIDLLRAQQSGASPATVADLQDEYQKASDVDENPNPPDQTWVLIELLRAEQRGADPAYLKMLEDKYRAFDRAREAKAAADDAMRRSIPTIDTGAIRAARKEQERLADARTRQLPVHVPPAAGLLEQLTTVVLLTIPAWGPVLWKKYRNSRA